MKGTTTLEITQATMIEALQMYFDSQFTKPHEVKSVKGNSNSGYGGNSFEVELAEPEPTV